MIGQFFASILQMAMDFIGAIQSAINMVQIGISQFTENGFPNVLGSIWEVLPSGFQIFAVSFLIVGLFVALISAVLRRS